MLTRERSEGEREKISRATGFLLNLRQNQGICIFSSSSGRHTGLHSDTKEEKEEKKTKMEFENTRKEWERESWLNIDVTSQALSIKRNSFHQTESKYTASIRPEEDEEREEEKHSEQDGKEVRGNSNVYLLIPDINYFLSCLLH